MPLTDSPRTPVRFSLDLAAALLAPSLSNATHARYQQQLERSGCTQLSELQGCDTTKTKADNAKAGFAPAPVPSAAPTASASPCAGQWVAQSDSGKTVATIRVDAREHVWVNGQQVKARRADGGLMFKGGKLSFMIQGDRRRVGADTWTDFDAGTKGQVSREQPALPTTLKQRT